MMNGKHELLGKIARRSLQLAALLAMVLTCATAGRAQTNATPVPAQDSKPVAATTAPAQTPTASAQTPSAITKPALSPANVSALPAEKSHAKGTQEGIKVHGHWIIEVHNPDGKVQSHTEFENSLSQPYATDMLANLLSGQATFGGWAIGLGYNTGGATSGGPCGASGTPSGCIIVSSQLNGYCTAANSAGCFQDLTVAPTSFASNNSSTVLTLQGTALATNSATVGYVSTFLGQCPSTVLTANCTITETSASTNGFVGPYAFTSKALDGLGTDPNPVPVTAGQTIAVTVQISFQ
jgi:hypothetical protein